MRSEELRNLQAPMKDKYREQPESAIINLKAEVKTKIEIDEQINPLQGFK